MLQLTRAGLWLPAITDVLREVFARDPENFYDDVLLVDEDGRLLGIISTETLFKVQNALLLANICQLEKKEREIREKNEQMESELRMAMELQHAMMRSEEHTSELQSRENLVCRLLLEKKKRRTTK